MLGEVEDQKLLEAIDLDFGFNYFDSHDSGIALRGPALEKLQQAVAALQSYPEWTVLLEGHCPGKAEENCLLRETISEEAAEMCREHLEQAGVANMISCAGFGSAEGLGLVQVKLSVRKPPVRKLEVEPWLTSATATTNEPTDPVEAGQYLPPNDKEADAMAAPCAAEVSRPVTLDSDDGALPARDPRSDNPSLDDITTPAQEGLSEVQPTPVAASVEERASSAAVDEAPRQSEGLLERQPDLAAASAEESAADTCAAPLQGPDEQQRQSEKTSEREPTSLALAAEEGAAVAAASSASCEQPPRAEDPAVQQLVPDAAHVEESVAAAAEPSAVEQPARSAPSVAEDSAAAAAAAATTEVPADSERNTDSAAPAADAPATEEVVSVNQSASPAAAAAVSAVSASASLASAAAAAATSEDQVSDRGGEASGLQKTESEDRRHSSESQRSAAKDIPAALPEDEPVAEEDIVMPDLPQTEGLPHDAVLEKLSALLQTILESGARIAFEANRAAIAKASTPTVRRLAYVLQRYSVFPVVCIGHAKGKPAENNDAKRTLSQQRAEALRNELRGRGVLNEICCVGCGSSYGRGLGVRLELQRAGSTPNAALFVEDPSWMIDEQQEATLNQLLKETLAKGVAFEANKATVREEAGPVLARLASILKHFPKWVIRCEGHAKGKPEDNNEAKMQLSLVRAEAIRSALNARGVLNSIICQGHGCSAGLGACVQMTAVELERELEVPEAAELVEKSASEQIALANSCLEKALERGIDFEPNKCLLPASGLGVIRSITRIVEAFPGLAFKIEGHAKGRPDENNPSKQKLSQGRAETVRAAILQGCSQPRTIEACGEGSAQGLGMCVRMFVIETPGKDESQLPDMADLSREERAKLVNRLLEEALETSIEFAPNVHDVPLSSMPTIRDVARILKCAPDLPIRCEGHTKGEPNENSDAKKKLSRMRAEAVKAAVRSEGVESDIICFGEGSAQGRGMRVRMVVMEEHELEELQVDIPDTSGKSFHERAQLLNELLAQALQNSISFDPNSAQLHVSAIDTVEAIARILGAFPDFPIRCEGHTKGKAAENSDARVRLSQMRAEAVRQALAERGTPNAVECIGMGSSQGVGMCVKMYTPEAEAEVLTFQAVD
eukprot:TRINITY_DN39826_c0_g2_i1.p1 TRINITY_DN39826_c0_g2~~TRINITY_DN39826_c0_g2_i1.p1  ORF type:complete len:1133 (+),score=336.67 TRINITY_DN39826_c0_g2_i1:76-3474(+)